MRILKENTIELVPKSGSPDFETAAGLDLEEKADFWPFF
jgi:hypothetical protein